MEEKEYLDNGDTDVYHGVRDIILRHSYSWREASVFCSRWN